MYTKFLKHGIGDGEDAVNYLLGELDHKGERREDVRILRGNPNRLGRIINAQRFAKRYTAGVIAWALEDSPRNHEIEEVLEKYQFTAYAGLDQSQFDWAAVQHENDKGEVHVHTILLNADLDSGRAFNPCPPGFESLFQQLTDHFNFKYGWARPTDPKRARIMQPGNRPPRRIVQFKETIKNALVEKIVTNQIKTRDDVLVALKRFGDLVKVEKRRIVLLTPLTQDEVAFQGLLFNWDFSPNTIIQALDRVPRAERELPNEVQCLAALERWKQSITSRGSYNRSKFPSNLLQDAKEKGQQNDPQEDNSGTSATTARPSGRSRTSRILREDRKGIGPDGRFGRYSRSSFQQDSGSSYGDDWKWQPDGFDADAYSGGNDFHGPSVVKAASIRDVGSFHNLRTLQSVGVVSPEEGPHLLLPNDAIEDMGPGTGESARTRRLLRSDTGRTVKGVRSEYPDGQRRRIADNRGRNKSSRSLAADKATRWQRDRAIVARSIEQFQLSAERDRKRLRELVQRLSRTERFGASVERTGQLIERAVDAVREAAERVGATARKIRELDASIGKSNRSLRAASAAIVQLARTTSTSDRSTERASGESDSRRISRAFGERIEASFIEHAKWFARQLPHQFIGAGERNAERVDYRDRG